MEVKQVCEICKFSDTNVYDYGEWKTSGDCTIHYFCALLSYSCLQNGADDEGIAGFLVPDIRQLIKAHAKSRCRYCPKKGATVRCALWPQCKTLFHVKCGVKSKCLNQFEDPFESFCRQHVNIEEKFAKHADYWHCQICDEIMGDYDPITSIPSCCDQGYYHKLCMQKYAAAAGYLAKCPSCGNDADGYRKFLRSRGIFCPDKDADWELSQDAYRSLLYVHKRCDVADCLCPNGREYVKNQGKWMIYRCRYCGSVGIHAGCRENESTGPYGCKSCIERDSILICVQTQSSNNNNSDKVHDISKLDGADSSNQSSNRKRKHDFDEEGDGKVWRMVPTAVTSHRESTLCLTNPEEEPNADPLDNNARQNMRQNRLNMFFSTANFDSKPQIPPWII